MKVKTAIAVVMMMLAVVQSGTQKGYLPYYNWSNVIHKTGVLETTAAIRAYNGW